MVQFLLYWWHNAQAGWGIGDGIFEKIEGLAFLVSAGCLCHKKWFKHRSTLEDNAMKWAFHLFWISFVFSTVFVAPFLQNKHSTEIINKQAPTMIDLSNQVDQLTADLGKVNGLIQIQNTTIQSYQAENAKLTSRLSDIESANDPSAKAVKKRALNLCKQLEDFYQDYSTNESAFTQQAEEQETAELSKFGWRQPTNAVEKADWQQNRQKVFDEFMPKEQAFEAQWAVKFTVDFYGQIAVMRDQLAALGLRDKELDSHLESPFFTRVFFSQDLAMRIAYLANQIKE